MTECWNVSGCSTSESHADLWFNFIAHCCLFEGLNYHMVTLEMVRLILLYCHETHQSFSRLKLSVKIEDEQREYELRL